MITPASGGTTSRRISLSRCRSVSGSLRLMPGRRRARHVDQIAAGKRHLGGQPGALVPDRILADLDDDVVAGLEGLFDLAAGAAEAGGLPVHLAGVQHAVAAAADVDERRLHRRQHVLHDAQVDVADQRRRRRRRDEMLDDDPVFEHRDLGVAGALVRRFGADLVAHHHRPLDGLTAGQEFGLAQDRRTAAAGVAAVPAALPLGLQPGRPADALDLAVVRRVFGLGRSRRPLVHDGVGRIVGRGTVVVVVVVPGAGLAATTTTATTAGGVGAAVLVAGVVGLIGVVGILVADPWTSACRVARSRCRRSRRRSAHRDHGHVRDGPGGGAGRRAAPPGRRRNRGPPSSASSSSSSSSALVRRPGPAAAPRTAAGSRPARVRGRSRGSAATPARRRGSSPGGS